MWKNRHGFTLVEMLVVVAVLVILLAGSAVGVVRYLRQIRITELDNAAREIYLAAQNRAILLQGSQRLEGLVVQAGNRIEHVDVIPGAEASEEGTTQITVYYRHSQDAAMEDLLPRETIEPSLWEGDFYIVYEPESASVVDVFFSWGTLPVGGDFEDFYQQWRAAPRTKRMNQDPMIGYFGGQSAESGTSISLRTPVINIYNENTLWAEVTYWVPNTMALTGEEKKLSIRAFDRRDALAAYEKQGHKCAICGEEFEFEQMHADHITPWSKGGKTTPDNCQMLCRDCNLKKGAQE